MRCDSTNSRRQQSGFVVANHTHTHTHSYRGGKAEFGDSEEGNVQRLGSREDVREGVTKSLSKVFLLSWHSQGNMVSIINKDLVSLLDF